MFCHVSRSFSVDSLGCPLEHRLPHAYRFPGESHDFTEMVFVAEGRIELVEEGRVFLMREGDLIFHAPMEFHRLRSVDGTRPRLFNLSFTATGEVPCALYEGVFHLSAEGREAFVRMFRTAQAFLSGERERGQCAADALCAFLWYVLSDASVGSRAVTDPRARLYEALVNDMQKGVADNLTVEVLAERHHVSLGTVKAIFRRYADVSPKQYYRALRLSEAARRLSAGQSVAEVAQSMSFSSAAYLTVFFKSATGMTPAEYRRAGAPAPLP